MASFQPTEDGSRVIRFRPRASGSPTNRRGGILIGNPEPNNSPVPDLAKYEDPENDDEYRHRMIVNAAAAAFTSLLIYAGLWLAAMMAHP